MSADLEDERAVGRAAPKRRQHQAKHQPRPAINWRRGGDGRSIAASLFGPLRYTNGQSPNNACAKKTI